MITGLVSKQSSPNWDAHPLLEYLLLAHPDATVNEQVLVEKNYFFNEYRQPIATKTKPHITVAHFLAKEEMEQTLLRWIQRVCDNQPRFVTTLNNFSGFPAHTIYLRVQNHQPYKELAKGLKAIEEYVRSNDCPPVHLVSTPHLAVARSLSEEVYEKAIQDFSQRLFHASFSVDNLLLIKRKHQREAFQHVTLFPLAAQPYNLFN